MSSKQRNRENSYYMKKDMQGQDILESGFSYIDLDGLEKKPSFANVDNSFLD